MIALFLGRTSSRQLFMMVALAVLLHSALGQSPAAASPKLPQFEVASVKPNPRGGIAGIRNYPGGRIECQYCTVWMLVMYAFNIQHYQIRDAPAWSDRQGFSIKAVPPDTSEARKLTPPSLNAPLSDEQRQMLQSLLMERFHLQYHRERKTGPVFDLLQKNIRGKLLPPKNPNAEPGVFLNFGFLEGRNAPMSMLAARVSQYLERPVLDRTGLTGNYDFDYKAPEDDSRRDYGEVAPAIIGYVQALGLTLKSDTGPVESIIIDHVEEPSPD